MSKDLQSEPDLGKDTEDEEKSEGEGACCACGGSCILLWVGLVLFHAGLLFVVLFYGRWTLTFFVLISYAVTVRVAIWKLDTPWMISILWIVFVFVIALAGAVLSNSLVPLEYHEPIEPYQVQCYFDVCSQVPNSTIPLRDWCRSEWFYPKFTLINGTMFFTADENSAIMSHDGGGVRLVKVNGVSKVKYGYYDAINSLQNLLVLNELYTRNIDYVYTISAFSLKLSDPKVITATGSSLYKGYLVSSMTVINGSIYWQSGSNNPPLPYWTAYISDGTIQGTMTTMDYYGIKNPCTNTSTTPVYNEDGGDLWCFWALLLFSCFPYCLSSFIILLASKVKAMIFCLYLGASYSLFVLLLGCSVEFFVADNIMFFISYFMILIAFIVLIRFPRFRIYCGWVLLATTLCYYIFTPSFFLTFKPIPHIIRFFVTLSILFVGLMVPSIPVILCACGGIITFIIWFLIYIDVSMMFSFVLLAIIGLTIIVGVVQLKRVLKDFRQSFYEKFVSKAEEGGVDHSLYESYLEEELMTLTPRKVEIV